MSEKEARKKAPANYALEVFVKKDEHEKAVWAEINDGFVSPEQAIEFATKEKVIGVIRVVRIASPLMGGDVVIAEPIYVLKKIGEEKKQKVRKQREKKEVKVSEEKPVTPSAPAETKKPIVIEEAVVPLVVLNPSATVVVTPTEDDEFKGLGADIPLQDEEVPLPDPDEHAGELDADGTP